MSDESDFGEECWPVLATYIPALAGSGHPLLVLFTKPDLGLVYYHINSDHIGYWHVLARGVQRE